MIGNIITDDKGIPLDHNGNTLSPSTYQPPDIIKKLFARVQQDYQIAWRLQHRPFQEFDGISLLDRARLDQQTFGAYVGASFSATNKQWRWKGRKNTARNKVIAILAHLIAGMLFPYCYAYNEDDEEDKMTANVMRILVENHLKKADYEIKFLFMVTSALVNPAVFVRVEFVQAMQRIKVRDAEGNWQVEEAVDELLSGINLNIRPIDQVLLGDFYIFDVQRQPYIINLDRITWDEARQRYAGKYFIDGKDQFDYVRAGATRIVLGGQEHQTLYDIEWTEADLNAVQVINIQYRGEDLELDWVGGVFMSNYDEKNPESVYNINGFKHRRMSMINDKWMSIPVYDLAKSGYEPLDPAGRFAYYKSACFKEFWDDASQNRMFQLAHDASYLDTIKPIFLSGVAKMDASAMVPGATIGMPPGAQVTPYEMSPNIAAVLQIMQKNEEDMKESTNDNPGNVAVPNVSAYAVSKAQQNAQVQMGVCSIMVVDLLKQVGELVVDDIIIHTTVGEVDATVPEALRMKYKPLIARGKDNGKDVTNKIEFSNDVQSINALPISDEEKKNKLNDMEWQMFEDAGGMSSTMRHYKVDPYKFARQRYSVYIDPDILISRSMGTDQMRKDRAFNIMMDPRVAPFVNQEAVIDKFVLEEYSDGDPDEFKNKNPQGQGQQPGKDNEMLQSIMGNPALGKVPVGGQGVGQPVGSAK